MPISQQIGSSSLAKPGVCTSTTRPASPYNGQVIYETDTARTLVWNGSGWVFLSTSTANPVGLELITSCTITSVGGTSATASNGAISIGSGNTSITVSNAFSTTFQTYRIILSNCLTSINSTDIRFQLEGLTTTVYNYSMFWALTASNTTSNNQANSASFAVIGASDTGSANGFSIDIYGPNAATRTGISGTAFGSNLNGLVGAQVVDTSQRTGFILTLSGGSFSSGTIRVYGYRNAA